MTCAKCDDTGMVPMKPLAPAMGGMWQSSCSCPAGQTKVQDFLRPTVPTLADLLPIAQRYLELQREHGGMLVDVIDYSTGRMFAADFAQAEPYPIDVLRMVAAAVSLAAGYGYSLEQIAASWTEWNANRLDLENCPECGLEHERRTGCPPRERRPERA